MSGAVDSDRGAELEDCWPWTSEVAQQTLARLREGRTWKQCFETALLELDEERADHLMLLAREARAAWLVMLAGEPGRALCIGNACSGAAVALARAGHRVVLVDRSHMRLELGIAQVRAMAGSKALAVRIGEGARLPFQSDAFELVLEELHLPQARAPWKFDPSELARVCAGELVVSANNRLGYKRSAGRRADFRVPSPFAFVAGALSPAHGERTLRGYRAWLRRAGMSEVRAFALYPHQSDFTHLVALDGGGPRLMIGPKERGNQAKMIATRLGLFPWLTPSFAFIARRESKSRAKTRLERVLQELSQRTGEPQPEAEYVHATRGNTTLVMTRVQGAASDDPRGRWAVHIPLSRQQEDQLVKHQARLSLIRERFPALKVPQPLWIGRAAGLTIACERRLDGLTAPQYTGEHGIAARMFSDAARDFSTLIMRPARVFDAADFERLVASRFELVARFAVVPATIQNLAALCERLRAQLIGTSFPLVLQHADLRSKHVQLAADGSVLGYLDWGSSELDDLPYFDLLHLIVHERKHEADLTAQAAWAIVRERKQLREHEQRALDDYSERIGLDERVRRAIETMYPVLVAAMAERNWDYSRPRWLSRQFGV
ncbi:MAG TPA: hypothetical protein VK843_10860 [Planctomycetota bacterium]|nr:hypothetical protein [Planctomycetota bacterium]